MKPATRQIFCATDFSPNAQGAAEVAREMAAKLGASLRLVHVADPGPDFGESPQLFRPVLRRARASLKKEAARLRGRGVPVREMFLRARNAGPAITAALDQDLPSLAVVSSVSKTLFDRWTLGSVSEYITQHSPVPTLVVRAPERLLEWARGARKLNVIVAVDFTVSSDAALSFVRDLWKVGACNATVAHVEWPPEARRRLPSLGSAVRWNEGRARAQLLRNLRRKIGEFLPDETPVHLESNWGRPDAPLVHYAARADADLIVVGAHQRHGLERITQGSISRGILRHALMSVACAPVPAALAHGVEHHPRIDRVLVATDLSATGDQAIPWAYALAARDGVVKLVHVMTPASASSPLPYRGKNSLRRRTDLRSRVAGMRKRLVALVPVDAAAAGVRTEMELVDHRDAARGIAMAVRSFEPDLICLAMNGLNSGGKTAISPVIREVIAGSRQPVLLVKPEEP